MKGSGLLVLLAVAMTGTGDSRLCLRSEGDLLASIFVPPASAAPRDAIAPAALMLSPSRNPTVM